MWVSEKGHYLDLLPRNTDSKYWLPWRNARSAVLRSGAILSPVDSEPEARMKRCHFKKDFEEKETDCYIA